MKTLAYVYVNQRYLKNVSEILSIFWNAGLFKALSQRYVCWQFQFIASQYIPNIYILSCDNR